MGRDVSEALTLSDPEPIGVVQEWGVRKLGLALELSTRAAIRKPVTVDLFPAYDEDGGLLVALDAADHTGRVKTRRERYRVSRLRDSSRNARSRGSIQSCRDTASGDAVGAVERRRSMALAPVRIERPADDDAALTLGRQPVDPGRDPREQRLAAAALPEGVGTRAVDRRPHDLGTDLRARPMSSRRGRPRGRARGLRGSRGRLLRPRTPQTKHSSNSGSAPAAGRRGTPPPPRRTSAAPAARDAGIAARASATSASPSSSSTRSSVPRHGERPLERWRQPQRHLDRRRRRRPGEQARGVAAVRRRARPAEPAGDRERCEHGGRVQFMPRSRKHGAGGVMRLALAQLDAVVGDLAGNRALIVDAIREARAAGADLVVFPELAVTGYPPEDLLLRPGFIKAARAVARRDRRARPTGSPPSSAARSSSATSRTRARCSPAAAAGRLPQAVPAELRRLRRAPLLRRRAGARPAPVRRRARRPDDLRGHLAARARRPPTSPSPAPS